MTPIQTPPGMSESAVDMSPEAIMSRLEMIGQLNEYCRVKAKSSSLGSQPTGTTAIPRSQRTIKPMYRQADACRSPGLSEDHVDSPSSRMILSILSS